MSEFSAKIHQIRFRLGLRHDPVGELAALRQAPNYWGEGAGCPLPKNPTPRSALWASIFGLPGLDTSSPRL